jgi:hypothetical protein
VDDPFGFDALIDPGQLVRLVVLKSDLIQLCLSIRLARGLL